MKKQNNSEKKKNTGNKIIVPFIIILIFILILLSMLALVYKFYMGGFSADSQYNTYDQYYVMIAENRRSSFMQNIYEGAYQEGISNGIYVDLLGDNLPNDYTEEDLLKIAISSQVDGIIIDTESSEKIAELIDQASEADIPVVTLLDDNANSKRCSFVGIGGYEIGREYGHEVIQIAKEIRKNYFMSNEYTREEEIASIDVAVLINSNSGSSSQNVIISGIREAVENEASSSNTSVNIEIVSVDNSNAFSVEESIRDLFVGKELPEVIICLDELSTTCVYQAVIDYNVVGKVNILGYYDSETILNAVDRGVIYSTVAVDTAQLGKYCVNALKDYNDLGATSQYYTGDVTLINRSNVASYLKKEEAEHE